MRQRRIKFSDFLTLISLRTGVREATVEKIYKAMIGLIEEEMKINGEIELKWLGLITVKVKPGKDRRVPLPTGGATLKYMPPSLKYKFSPSKRFADRMDKLILKDKDLSVKAEREEKMESIKDKLNEVSKTLKQERQMKDIQVLGKEEYDFKFSEDQYKERKEWVDDEWFNTNGADMDLDEDDEEIEDDPWDYGDPIESNKLWATSEEEAVPDIEKADFWKDEE